jgi:hypothetical protein
MVQLAAFLVFGLGLVVQAQSPQAQPLSLPDGNDAWIVHVVTSGGFLGAGEANGNFSVSSAGRILCSGGLPCKSAFNPSDLRALIQQIQVTAQAAPIPVVMSLCSDCITRTITITRRDSNGVVHSFTGSFDFTTKAALPREVIRVYDASLALMK